MGIIIEIKTINNRNKINKHTSGEDNIIPNIQEQHNIQYKIILHGIVHIYKQDVSTISNPLFIYFL